MQNPMFNMLFGQYNPAIANLIGIAQGAGIIGEPVDSPIFN